MRTDILSLGETLAINTLPFLVPFFLLFFFFKPKEKADHPSSAHGPYKVASWARRAIRWRWPLRAGL